MASKLSEPIAAYFAAVNEHEIDAMLATFAETAVVKDEGQEMRGLAAIKEWVTETTRKYAVSIGVLDVAAMERGTTVTARVSGNFPGSPIELRYEFSLAGAQISRLEIHP